LQVDADGLLSVSTQEMTSGIAALRRATQALAKASETFAARRMDHSVQKALAGQSIAQIEAQTPLVRTES
jgi:hypothetical protein